MLPIQRFPLVTTGIVPESRRVFELWLIDVRSCHGAYCGAMARLTTKRRAKLKRSSFALPGKRAYPIHDAAHARNALARVARHGTAAQKRTVRKAVKRRYPSIKVSGVRKRR